MSSDSLSCLSLSAGEASHTETDGSGPTNATPLVPKVDRIFMQATSLSSEIWIQFTVFLPIMFAGLVYAAPNPINNIFIGHMPNSEELMAGVNLATTYTMVLGTSISWAMCSALYTLVPEGV